MPAALAASRTAPPRPRASCVALQVQADQVDGEGGHGDGPDQAALVVVALGDAGDQPAHADAVGAHHDRRALPVPRPGRWRPAPRCICVPSLKILPTSTPRTRRSGAAAVRAGRALVGGGDVGHEIRLVVARHIGVEQMVAGAVGPGHQVGRAGHQIVDHHRSAAHADRRGVAGHDARRGRVPRPGPGAGRRRPRRWPAWSR